MSRTPTHRAVRGFSLLEVLLVVAIIGLIASVLIGGAVPLFGERSIAPGDVFRRAVQEARKTALKSGHEIRLKFHKEKSRFLLFDGTVPAVLAADGFTREETPLKEFPVPAAGGELAVDFLAPASKGGGGNAILVGGVLLEARTIPHVTFFPDGTCSPFRAQFVRGGGVTVLAIDPWTCAEVLTPPDPHALPAF
ncbi:MAG: prepilin-type N-terminal cleavage/methylation domain-containing protein [Opitutaceae bacterium]|nr:prepilin-type N-terminal cleavage/methylation domain-containing protein [Opitutaceae bacterium]